MNLVGLLDKKKATIKKTMEGLIRERDEAPTARESHHDQSRNELDQLIQSLKEQERDLLATERRLANWDKEVFEHKGRKFLMVPEGMGGEMIDDVFLLSENAPLAIELKK